MNKIIISIAAAAATAFTASADTSAWRVAEHIDPLDDTVTKSAQAMSGRNAVLAINCRAGELFAYLQVGISRHGLPRHTRGAVAGRR